MFEKEAEEYAKKKCGRLTPVNKCEWFLANNSYQEGTEFGYNKANKWRYIKDGDLPKESEGKCFIYYGLAEKIIELPNMYKEDFQLGGFMLKELLLGKKLYHLLLRRQTNDRRRKIYV